MTLKRIYDSPQNVRKTTATTANNVGKISNPKCISEHSSQQMWGTQPVLGNEIIEKTYIDHAEEEKNTDFQTVHEMSRLPSQNIKKTTIATVDNEEETNGPIRTMKSPGNLHSPRMERKPSSQHGEDHSPEAYQ